MYSHRHGRRQSRLPAEADRGGWGAGGRCCCACCGSQGGVRGQQGGGPCRGPQVQLADMFGLLHSLLMWCVGCIGCCASGQTKRVGHGRAGKVGTCGTSPPPRMPSGPTCCLPSPPMPRQQAGVEPQPAQPLATPGGCARPAGDAEPQGQRWAQRRRPRGSRGTCCWPLSRRRRAGGCAAAARPGPGGGAALGCGARAAGQVRRYCPAVLRAA